MTKANAAEKFMMGSARFNLPKLSNNQNKGIETKKMINNTQRGTLIF